MIYSKDCVETFLKNQGQLFDEPVATTYQEAYEFLDDIMAVVVNNEKEVKEYMEELGADIHGMTMEEILSSSEVFKLKKGKYLIVEG